MFKLNAAPFTAPRPQCSFLRSVLCDASTGWRLNGYGFSAGMGAGLVAGIATKAAAPNLEDYYGFVVVAGVSLVAMVGVTLATTPVPLPVLQRFYAIERPCGWWAPVTRPLAARAPEAYKAIRTENMRDFAAIPVAVIYQVCIFLALMCVGLRAWGKAVVLLVVVALCAVGIWWLVFRHLRDDNNDAPKRTKYDPQCAEVLAALTGGVEDASGVDGIALLERAPTAEGGAKSAMEESIAVI